MRWSSGNAFRRCIVRTTVIVCSELKKIAAFCDAVHLLLFVSLLLFCVVDTYE